MYISRTGITLSPSLYIVYHQRFILLASPWSFPNIRAINADSTENSSGAIKFSCTLDLHFNGTRVPWTFQVITLNDADAYLGFDWLCHHNPQINWKNLEVSLQDQDYLLWVKALPTLLDKVPLEYAEYAEVFTKENFNRFPPECPWDHSIKFLPDAPTSIPAWIYPLSPDKMKVCWEFLDENLETGRIIHGESPIISPFFFIKKSDWSLCPVIDYCIINGYTVPDHYPLPLINHIIMSLTAAMIFTKTQHPMGIQ